jgi:hypothetical protein
MAKKQDAPRKFVLVSEQPQIDAQQFPELHTLYLREIFASLQRRGLITTAQRRRALTSIDSIARKPG